MKMTLSNRMIAIVAGSAIAAGALAAAPLAATASPAVPAGGAAGYPVAQGAPGPAAQAAAVRYWTAARMSAALDAESADIAGPGGSAGSAGSAAIGGPRSVQAAGQDAQAGKKKAAKKKHAKTAGKQARTPRSGRKAAKAAKTAKTARKHAAAGPQPPRVPAVAVRHLVKQAPPVAPQGPWVAGDTAGQGLRWTHGGAVSSAVGKVFFSSGGTDYVCSGTLVGSGQAETVLTAAHCVSGGAGPAGRQRWVSNWVFVPGYRGGLMPDGMFTAQRFFTARGWTGPQGGTEQYDVAFVQVAVGTLTGKSGPMAPPPGLAVSFASRQDAAVPARAYVFGYPSQSPFSGLYANYCAGPVTGAGGSVRTTCVMTAGDSGGPWLASFSPLTGSGPVMAVSTYKVSTDLTELYGAVLGPQARAIYQRAVSTAR
jgi:V8-like Glu-specific endopeptidase